MPTAPTTTRAGRPGKVDVALAVLRGGWVNGRELLDGVRGRSQDILGELAAYDNANAVARNAKAAGLRHGFCWQYMQVDYEERTAGADHRLWTVTREMIPRPHAAWQRGRAKVVMCQGNAEVTYEPPDLEAHKERTAAEIERREADLRGGSACDNTSAKPNPRGPLGVSEGAQPNRSRPSHICLSGNARQPESDGQPDLFGET